MSARCGERPKLTSPANTSPGPIRSSADSLRVPGQLIQAAHQAQDADQAQDARQHIASNPMIDHGARGLRGVVVERDRLADGETGRAGAQVVLVLHRWLTGRDRVRHDGAVRLSRSVAGLRYGTSSDVRDDAPCCRNRFSTELTVVRDPHPGAGRDAQPQKGHDGTEAAMGHSTSTVRGHVSALWQRCCWTTASASAAATCLTTRRLEVSHPRAGAPPSRCG